MLTLGLLLFPSFESCDRLSGKRKTLNLWAARHPSSSLCTHRVLSQLRSSAQWYAGEQFDSQSGAVVPQHEFSVAVGPSCVHQQMLPLRRQTQLRSAGLRSNTSVWPTLSSQYTRTHPSAETIKPPDLNHVDQILQQGRPTTMTCVFCSLTWALRAFLW